MLRFCIVLLLLVCPHLSIAATSKQVLFADRSIKPDRVHVDQQQNMMKIEICGKECELYSARRLKSEDEMWDVVLLHRAFFGDAAAAKSFRGRNAAHISMVMAAYADQCSKYPQDATRAICILKHLARRNRISYAQVKYEDDSRCETEADLLAASRTVEQAKCERIGKTR